MFDLTNTIEKRNRAILLFLIFFIALFSGFHSDVGRETNSREPWSYPDSPFWQASYRSDQILPAEYHQVYVLVMGESEETVGHNTLDMGVFRDVTSRHDQVLSDEEASQYFDHDFNSMVLRNTTTGPWGIAETVRDIMDKKSPLYLPEEYGGINYTGPDFLNATDLDLSYVLNHLMNARTTDGTYWARGLTSPDLCILSSDSNCTKPQNSNNEQIQMTAQNGEIWTARGFWVVAQANSTRLFSDYSLTADGDKPYYELYEKLVDDYYYDLESDQAVSYYGYGAISLEMEREVNSTMPLVGVSFIAMVILLGIYFRDWRDTFFSAFGLLVLMGSMFANLQWLGYPQTQISAMLPILMLALGVDFTVHSLTRWKRLTFTHSLYNKKPKQASAEGAFNSIGSLFPALGIATITTMVAFGTASMSKIPDLYEWGILASIGILEAYFIMGVFTPLARSVWPPKIKEKTITKVNPVEQPQVSRNPLFRLMWIIAGTFCIVLGTIGIWIPGLPTTSFYVLAAAFYARGSQRLYDWLLNHKFFGKPIRDYREGRGMPFRSKLYTLSMMWIAILVSVHYLTIAGDPGYGQLTIIFVGLIGTWFLCFKVPTQFEKNSDDSLNNFFQKSFDMTSISNYLRNNSKGIIIVFVVLTLLLSPLHLGHPESTFEIRDYADNDSRLVQTITIGKVTFTEEGEPGFYLVEGESLEDFETLLLLEDLYSNLEDMGLVAYWVPSVTNLLRIQSTLAISTGQGHIPTSIDPISGLPTDSEDAYKILADIYRNGTRSLDSTFQLTPGDAKATYHIDDNNLTHLKIWFMVGKADDLEFMRDLLVVLESLEEPLESTGNVTLQVTGPSYKRYVYLTEITESFEKSLLTAIVLSFFILLVALGDFRLTIITILPVAAITIWLRGGMVLTDTSINLVTVQISSLAVGLGVDYSIHMVQRIREARRENPKATQIEWMTESMDETGKAVATSAITDLIGFLILTLSIMPLFVMFGTIMGIMISLSFIAALVMLPVLLYQFGELEKKAIP